MRKSGVFRLVLSLLAVAAVAHAADGTVSMTWSNTCAPVVQNVAATSGPASLMFSVIGNDQTHTA